MSTIYENSTLFINGKKLDGNIKVSSEPAEKFEIRNHEGVITLRLKTCYSSKCLEDLLMQSKEEEDKKNTARLQRALYRVLLPLKNIGSPEAIDRIRRILLHAEKLGWVKL